jgi:hydroxyacylglutathione hydrolase
MKINIERIPELLAEPSVIFYDCRSAESFSEGFIPESIYAGHSQFNFNHLATVFPRDSKVVVVLEDENHAKVVKEKLAVAGFNNFLGYVSFDVKSWMATFEKIDLIIGIEADELSMDIPHDENLMLVDVREADEYEISHFADSHSLPLSEMGDAANIAMLPDEANLYIFCTDGERSLSAASILKRHGIHNFRVVNATWDELQHTKGLTIEKNSSGKLN